MDVMAGITAATQALSLARTLKDIEKSVDGATYRATIADLMDKMTDAKLALADAKEELSRQAAEIARLREDFHRRSTLRVGPGGYHYPVADDGGLSGYPVCPHCEQKDGRVVQLKRAHYIHKAQCPVCDRSFSPVACFTRDQDGSAITESDLLQRKKAAQAQPQVYRIRRRNPFTNW